MKAAEIICMILPLRIVSVANLREHWRTRAGRARLQRTTTALLLRSYAPPQPPLTITLTRTAARKLDSDNLASAFKAVRDGVADWLGIDDGDARLTWVYAQRKASGSPAAEVAIFGTMDDDPLR